MDTQSILNELEAERERLSRAIAALQAGRQRLGRPKASNTVKNGRKGARRLSAAARRRIAMAAKARWAKAKAAGRKRL